MDKIDQENSFLNLNNIKILCLIWIPFCIISLILPFNIDEKIKDYLQIVVTIFSSLSAITGILYSTHKSDMRNEKSIKNSNKQLIEQLTKEKKEKALYELLITSMKTINENLNKIGIQKNYNIKTIAEYYEKTKPTSIQQLI